MKGIGEVLSSYSISMQRTSISPPPFFCPPVTIAIEWYRDDLDSGRNGQPETDRRGVVQASWAPEGTNRAKGPLGLLRIWLGLCWEESGTCWGTDWSRWGSRRSRIRVGYWMVNYFWVYHWVAVGRLGPVNHVAFCPSLVLLPPSPGLWGSGTFSTSGPYNSVMITVLRMLMYICMLRGYVPHTHGPVWHFWFVG
jgi:hypothetical protein